MFFLSDFSPSNAEKFRFSAEFIELRRQGLDVFVNRVASHHDLQQSEDLRTFLQADEEVMYPSNMDPAKSQVFVLLSKDNFCCQKSNFRPWTLQQFTN